MIIPLGHTNCPDSFMYKPGETIVSSVKLFIKSNCRFWVPTTICIVLTVIGVILSVNPSNCAFSKASLVCITSSQLRFVTYSPKAALRYFFVT